MAATTMAAIIIFVDAKMAPVYIKEIRTMKAISANAFITPNAKTIIKNIKSALLSIFIPNKSPML